MTAKHIIERHFSHTANLWRDRIYKTKENQRWWEYFDKQYRFDYVVDMIASLPLPARALDIGCGAGQPIPILVNLGWESDANDISQNMVTIAQTLCRETGVTANIKLGDCENLHYRDNTFDLIVANILQRPLGALSPSIVLNSSPGATIVLSGLLDSQASSIVATYRGQGLHLRNRFSIDGWTTVIMTRPRQRAIR